MELKKIKSITLDADLIESIEKQSKKESRSFSSMVSVMCRKYLNLKK